jgi:hypothetical protein
MRHWFNSSLSYHNSLNLMKMGCLMHNFKFMRTSLIFQRTFNTEAQLSATVAVCTPLFSATPQFPLSTPTQTISPSIQTKTSRLIWSNSRLSRILIEISKSSFWLNFNIWRKDQIVHSIKSKNWCNFVRIYSSPYVKDSHNSHCKSLIKRRLWRFLTFCHLSH